MPILLYNTAESPLSSLQFDAVVMEAAHGDHLDSHLFILPTPRMLREVERTLTRTFFERTGRPIPRLPLHTISSFVAEFHGRLRPTPRNVSPEVSLALMQLAMERADLSYYARDGQVPSLGVVEKIARVISGVRADGIMPSDFDKDIEYAHSHPDEHSFDTRKLSDLRNIYGIYLRMLNRRWSDHSGRIAHINIELARDRNAAFRRTYPNISTFLVYGFSEFRQPELAVLAQLGHVAGLESLIYFDYARENGPLYGNFEEMHDKLVTSGYRSKDLDPFEAGIPEERRRPFRHHMRRNLFRTDDRIENDSFDDHARVYGFFNREEEAQGIAMLVKSLVLDDDIGADRICITTFAMDRYAELLRERLAEHGVPSNITAPFRLNRNSLLTALLAALAIPANGYDRRDIIRAISSPYLDFGPDVDAAALTEASTALRIRRGRSTWMRRLRDRLDYLHPRIAGIPDDDDRRGVELEVETLERAERSINELSLLLDELDRRMTPAEFRTSFHALMARLRVAERVLALRHDLNAHHRTPQDWQRMHDEMERDTRALAAFLTLLDEMTEFFASGAGDDVGGETTEAAGGKPADAATRRRPLEYYIEHLRTAAANARFGLREKHEYGVLVAPISAIEGRDFDVVILCGMVDGEFPSTYIPESFLGRPLPDAEDRQLRRERVLFYSAITACRSRLVVTYPRFAGSAALVRSSFVDALLRITTLERSGNVIELDELRSLRGRTRAGEELTPALAFVSSIATLDGLAEEAGATLWGGGRLPRVTDAGEMLDNLEHTSAVEAARHHAQSAGDHAAAMEYRGIITSALDQSERDVLAARRTAEYSPSQLELFARCPFKYFARRIVGAHSSATYDVSLTPLERGLLLHKVLFRLYTDLRSAGELPITEESESAVLARARGLAREEISGIVFDHPYWKIDQERILGSEALEGLLRQWITTDARRTDEGMSLLTPEYFEVGFGSRSSGDTDAILSSDEAIERQGLRLRGKVDRVEIYHQGDEIYFTVADYKTGTPPSRTEIREGMSLQLVMYLEVIRQLLAQHYNVPIERVRPVGGIYYRLDARTVDTETKALFVPNELKKEILALRSSRHDPETVDDLIAFIGDMFSRAAEYVAAIGDGVFPVTSGDVSKICRGCEYFAACRVSQAWMPPKP